MEDPEVIEAGELIPYGNGNLPMSQSVAPTKEGSQIDAVMRLSELAWRRPRNEPAALRKCLAAADASWLWRVPNRGEGLSVKCARSIIRYYQNVAVIPNVLDTMIPTDSGMKPGWAMTVVAVDMENMVIETSTATTPKPERNKGEKELAYQQRCFQAQLAFLGRLERNAIMKIAPGEWQGQIKAEILRREQGKPLAERVPKLIMALAAIGVNERDIEIVLGCKPLVMAEAQYQDLIGRGGAVKEGECTKDMAFPELAREVAAADEPVNITALEREFKTLGIVRATALEIARELHGDTLKRLENMTRAQGEALIATLKAMDAGAAAESQKREGE